MTTYRRPNVGLLTFHDAAGAVIDYGNRWVDGPPADSYEVVEHPERFAPLHTVTAALIDYLVSNYEVIVEEGYQVTIGLENPPKPDDVVRAVRLTPRATGCAPLVFVLTNFPGVRLYAGLFFNTAHPSCGCNACDENWVAAADEFESHALTVTGGGLTEEVSEPRRPRWSFDPRHGLIQGMGQTISYNLRTLDGLGESSGESRAENVAAGLLAQARATLDELAKVSPAGNWLPWSPRIE